MTTRTTTARQIVDICRRLYERRLVTATDGNVSARLSNGNILVTPSGLAKGRLREKDLIEVGPDGRPPRGARPPTSELGMHVFIYRMRPDAAAVVHSHPPYATGFAAARRTLDAGVFPEVILGLGTVPLAPYATPSTDEVAQSIAPFVKTARAILLANHGVVTIGRSLEEAYTAMEKVEGAAHALVVAALLGGAQALSPVERERLEQARTHQADENFMDARGSRARSRRSTHPRR